MTATPINASFSFGFIGLSKKHQNADTLKHEYGHKLQMNNLGVLNYVFDVAIPSVTINALQRAGKLPYDYYSYPWEKEANTLGGSALSQGWKSPLPQGSDTSLWELVKIFF